MCGAEPPETVSDDGRLLGQQGFLLTHGDDPSARIVRCLPPERTPQCWRSVCVVREFAGLRRVEFMAGVPRGDGMEARWRSLRYLR